MPGDRRLLALHERRGRQEPLVWDPVTGEQREIWLRDPGDMTADWYDDGRALLIIRDHRGRTELYRYDLARRRRCTPIETPHGVIDEAAARARRHRRVLLVQRRPPAGHPVQPTARS